MYNEKTKEENIKVVTDAISGTVYIGSNFPGGVLIASMGTQLVVKKNENPVQEIGFSENDVETH